MTKDEAISILTSLQEPEAWEPQVTEKVFTALQMAITALAKDMIEQLPSAQPEHSQNTMSKQPDLDTLGVKTGETCSDTISRQDAIRIVDGIDTWQAGWRGDAIESMKALPSAQPEPSDVARDIATIIENEKDMRVVLRNSEQLEIIYCKDCKHYKAYEYTGKLACHYVIGGTVIRKPDDFCSRAEKAERITDE